MNKYNYYAAIKEDIKEYILDNYTKEELKEALKERDELEEKLNDELWTVDSVTGNASGSYTFNRWVAEQYVKDNLELMCSAMQEFGCDELISEKLINKEYEYLDVTIRCYLLNESIYAVLNELEGEYENF